MLVFVMPKRDRVPDSRPIRASVSRIVWFARPQKNVLNFISKQMLNDRIQIADKCFQS